MATAVVESAARSAMGVFFEYNTPRIVHIRSKKVGVINRLLQLIIIGYVIGYAIVYKKGYQEFDNVQSAITTKVKGLIFSDDGLNSTTSKRTWDVADYVIPPRENDAFFVLTNVIVTPMQTQTTCPESTSVSKANCTDDDTICDEYVNTIIPGGNGAGTGKCVNSSIPGDTNKTCEIYAWCPLEEGQPEGTSPVLKGARNFTVFIKNDIEFPRFNVHRRNIHGFDNNKELSLCCWKRDDPKNKFCPIFLLDDIVKDAGVDFDDMALKGGVMQIVIDWTCNLDLSLDDCLPEYSFRRLDSDSIVSPGYNFRYADKFMFQGVNQTEPTLHRNLHKGFGVGFLVIVQGKAGKFSMMPLLLNVGSGLALLGIATVLCDCVVLYLLKARNFYRDKKYLDVKGQDAYETMGTLEEDQSSVKPRTTNQDEKVR